MRDAAAALALLLFGAAGAAGAWSHVSLPLLLALLLWLPGHVLARVLGPAVWAGWGTGRIAVDAVLSLAVLTVALLPLYVARAPLVLMPLATGAVFAALAAAALWTSRASQPEQHRDDGAATTPEIAAFAVALILLLPAVLRYAGGNVDDWWDLAFVKSWIVRGHFHFEEPFLDTGRSHPRFLWSVWLSVQALVAWCSHAEPWRTQASALSALVTVGVISSYAALARAVFTNPPATALTIVMVPVWLWATEAVPFFTRVYQDKHVAGFVLAPVLVAMTLRALAVTRTAAVARASAAAHTTFAAAAPSAADTSAVQPPPTGPTAVTIAVACAAAATVSVHGLLYTMATFASLLALAAALGTETVGWLRTRRGAAVIVALLAPAIYPLAQAIGVAVAFGDQGIALSHADNPVVRAHLALERILFPEAAWWVVHPGAVFGGIAVAAYAALIPSLRRNRDASTRVLLVLALVPALLLFVPLLSAIAGALWVPWMLYRLGWMVPIPLLLACGVFELSRTGTVGLRRVFTASAVLILAVLSAGTAADRLRREMAEHPGPGAHAPRGNALAAYRFLAGESGGGRVLAMSGFGELVPALSGKPVVASTERQTLVFALEEGRAYARMRDRSEFFAERTTPQQRTRLADEHGARWAVLPRRLVPIDGMPRWVRRYGADAYLAAADTRGSWWCSTAEGAAAGLGESWSLVFENADYFVARRTAAAVATDANTDADGARDEPTPAWLAAVGADPSPGPPLFEDPMPRTNGMLASAAGYPGGTPSSSPPPQLLTPSQQPMWIGGGQSWEDLPAYATITLRLDLPCRVDAVRVVPYQPRLRREALEIRAGERTVRRQARHDVPIDIAVDAAGTTSEVAVHIRSLLGNALSLSDVALMGDPASCQGTWQPKARPSPMVARPRVRELLDLVASTPRSGRALVSLAHRVGNGDRDEAAYAMAEEAALRDPSLVAAWIDLGFSRDARGDADGALRAFEQAVVADSNSAWAHGVLAWAHVRRTSLVLALWHALRARSLDPYYADSWTLVAYVAHALRADSLAERALEAARRTDRERNWPYLARAEFAAARGDHEKAARVLREYLAHMPVDSEAREKLAAIERRGAAGQ